MILKCLPTCLSTCLYVCLPVYLLSGCVVCTRATSPSWFLLWSWRVACLCGCLPSANTRSASPSVPTQSWRCAPRGWALRQRLYGSVSRYLYWFLLYLYWSQCISIELHLYLLILTDLNWSLLICMISTSFYLSVFLSMLVSSPTSISTYLYLFLHLSDLYWSFSWFLYNSFISTSLLCQHVSIATSIVEWFKTSRKIYNII